MSEQQHDAHEACEHCEYTRRRETTRPDMLMEVMQHINEESRTRELVVEMRADLHKLADMHHGMSADEHQTLFEWWRAEVRARQDRHALWEKTKQSAIGWIVIAILGGLVHFGQPLGRFIIDKVTSVTK